MALKPSTYDPHTTFPQEAPSKNIDLIVEVDGRSVLGAGRAFRVYCCSRDLLAARAAIWGFYGYEPTPPHLA